MTTNDKALSEGRTTLSPDTTLQVDDTTLRRRHEAQSCSVTFHPRQDDDAPEIVITDAGICDLEPDRYDAWLLGAQVLKLRGFAFNVFLTWTKQATNPFTETDCVSVWNAAQGPRPNDPEAEPIKQNSLELFSNAVDDPMTLEAMLKIGNHIEMAGYRVTLAHLGLVELQRICHSVAVKGGWWTNIETGQPKDRNDGELLMLMVSEISEAMEGVRKNLPDDKLLHRRMVEVELADCIVRILDYAGGRNLDIAGALIEKVSFNISREDHKIENRKLDNGKKF